MLPLPQPRDRPKLAGGGGQAGLSAKRRLPDMNTNASLAWEVQSLLPDYRTKLHSLLLLPVLQNGGAQ